MICTFVLFYNPEEEPLKEKNNHTRKTKYHKAILQKIGNFCRSLLHAPLATAIATVQSVVYSLTNLFCVQQVLNMFIASNITTLVISIVLASGLFIGEWIFNKDQNEQAVYKRY